jgi:hypothetical protein
MSIIRSFSQNSKVEDYLNIISSEKKILKNLSGEDQSKQKQIENDTISKIASDFFTSIHTGGITVHDIVKNLYENYTTKDQIKILEKIGKESKIKIVHKPYAITLAQGGSIKNNEIPLYLSTDDSRFGYFKSPNKKKNIANKVYDINKTFTDISKKSLNVNPISPNKSNPSIVSILYNEPKYRFGTRNESELSFFFNSFTNLDIAKSYPYVNITIRMPTNIDNGLYKKKHSTSTVNQYLFGTISNKTKNYDIFNSYDLKEISHTSYTTNKKKDEVVQGTGMNLAIFSMPQTVNNFNEKSIGQSKEGLEEDNRINPVLDITRPLATIESINFTTHPIYDITGKKMGDISLTVHDRSRLTELAPFIKADLFGNHGSEIIIEYGWAHMDGEDSLNPRAKIINSMRVKEKYSIHQSSTSMGQDGQAKIKLSIMPAGSNTFSTILSNKTQAAVAVNNIKKSIRNVKTILNTINRFNDSQVVEIQYSFNNDIANVITLSKLATRSKNNSKKLEKLLKNTLNKIGNSFNFNENNIIKYINIVPEKLTTTSEGKSKLAENIKERKNQFNYLKLELLKLKELCKELNEKISEKVEKSNTDFKELFGNTDEDPYLDKELIKQITGIKDKKKLNKVLKKYCSFGKIVTNLVANNISSLGKVDEVQLVFHTANENAAQMRFGNISSFMIDKKEFEDFMKNDIFSVTRNIEYSIEAIFTRIIKEFIETQGQFCYGFRDIIKKKDPKGDGDFKDSIRKKLNELNIKKFTVPRIKYFLDCISPSIAGSSKSIDQDKTILRISFVDDRDDIYSTINETLKEVTEDNNIVKINQVLRSIKKGTKTQEAFENERISKLKELFESNKIDVQLRKESDGSESVIIPVKKLKNIKDQIKSRVPSVVLGAENSPVISASSSFSTAGALSGINITKGTVHYRVSGVKFDTDLPLRIIPSQVTLKMLGCPFLNFGQYIFVDFLTGTNLDNTYITTSINHSISPGDFTTTIVFGQGSNTAYGESYSGIDDIVKFLESIDNKKNKIIPKKKKEKPAIEKEKTKDPLEPDIETARKIYFHNNKEYNYENEQIKNIKQMTPDSVAISLPSYITFKNFMDQKKSIDKKSDIISFREYVQKIYSLEG